MINSSVKRKKILKDRNIMYILNTNMLKTMILRY